MSKRKISYISNIPYSTNDGGRWLRKALDPADTDVDIIGMPDTATNSRTVLNYQMQADIGVPDQDTYVTTNVSSYDADLYLYQNPIVFAMAASFPQGTKDPSTGAIIADWYNLTLTLAPNTAPRTVNIIMNDQIEGTTFNEKAVNFKNYCQRWRMIYGGVQGIPACSALFDSGTIEATQQIFNPEEFSTANVKGFGENKDILTPNSNLANVRTDVHTAKNKIFNVQRFNKADFPDSGNAIQNPAALYCRYKEGVYMPYKIRNPLVHNYINSEEIAVFESPYVMTNTVLLVVDGGDQSDQTVKYCGYMDYNPSTRQFTVTGGRPSNLTFVGQVSFYIRCYTKTACPFWLVLHAQNTLANNTPDYLNQHEESPPRSFNLPTELVNYCTDKKLLYVANHYTANNQNKTGETWAFIENADMNANTFISESPSISLPFKDTNVGVINFRSIGIQAAIRLVFRMGFELMVTAGSVYSPFKHKAPKYDEKAITNYIKACHNMRDAFLGNAATPEGHSEYSANMNNIVSSINNPGSGWYGRVSI